MASLQDKIDKDLANRKKEMIVLFDQVLNDMNNNNQSSCRSYLLIIYAHYEGFIISSTKKYLTYIQKEKLNFNLLNKNLKIFLKYKIFEHTQGTDWKKIHSLFSEEEFVFDNSIKCELIIKSNLIFETLETIINQISIRFSCDKIKTRKNYINEFVKKRNAIAHGEFLEIEDKNDIKDYHDFFIQLLSDYAEALKAAYENKYYLKETELSSLG